MAELGLRFDATKIREGVQQRAAALESNAFDGKTAGVEKTPEGGKNFSALLLDALQGVNQAIQESDKLSREVATGKAESLHGAIISAEKAELSFKTMMVVRNKVLDAYQEVMKMSI